MSPSWGWLVIAMMLAFAPASAQSTANVGHFERPFQFDVSAGTSFASDHSYCCSEGPVRFASAGVRWRPAGDGGFRFGVIGLNRSTTSELTLFSGGTDTVHKRERIFAVSGSFDTFFRLVGDLGAAVSVGAAFAPHVHGSLKRSVPGTYPQPYSNTATGFLYTGGLSLRYRWLFVEQHVLILNGANNAILNAREFFPVGVGIRF